MKHITIAVLVALSLVACGEKKEEPKPVAAAPAADNKPAEPAVLKASFEVPEKFRGYTDMLASYTNNEKEFRALPDSIFKDYKTAWEKQSYSIDKPDWYFAAVIQNPKLAEMTNDFKKQEAGEQVKATLTPDKNSLNVIVSANNEMQVLMDKPDIQTGIYKVNVTPKGVRSTVNQEFNGVRFGYGYELFYKEPLGLELPDCSGCKKLVALNVKVPLDKAKEIEEWREKGPDSMRAYGKVVSLDPQAGINSVRGHLGVNVEALEVGTFQGGKWHSYFFLSPEELNKARFVEGPKRTIVVW